MSDEHTFYLLRLPNGRFYSPARLDGVKQVRQAMLFFEPKNETIANINKYHPDSAPEGCQWMQATVTLADVQPIDGIKIAGQH